MIIPDGEVTVRGAYTNIASALSVEVTGTLNVAPGGNLSVAREVDVSGTGTLNVSNAGTLSAGTLSLSATANVSRNLIANTANVAGGGLTVALGGTLEVTNNADVTAAGSLNVDGTLNVGNDLNLAGGAISVSAAGIASVANEMNVDVDSSLTVLAGGALNVTTLNTTGTMNLTDATGTIGTINATGGTLNTAGSAITNLNVNGATVNTPGGADITHLQARGGQVNVTDEDLSVTTATLRPGVMDASVNALVVTENASLARMNIAVTGGQVKLSGVDPADHDVARTLTLQGGDVTIIDRGGDIPSGLLYHLDAAEGVTKDGSGNVSLWADQGPEANDFVQAAAAKQPLWIADGINGLPAIQFSGTTEELLLNTQTDPRTFFAVTTAMTGGGLRGIWGEENADAGVRLNNNTWYRGAGHGSDGNDFANGDAEGVGVNGTLVGQYTLNQPHIITEYKGPNHTKTPYSVTSIGEYFAGRGYHGDIAEMLVFDRILTAEEANNIGGYLADKYGIDVIGTSYEGQGIGTGIPNLTKTTIVATADSTLAVVTEPGQPVVLANVEVADGVALAIGNEANVQITNLTLGATSIAKSSLAAPVTGTSDGTVTVGGTLGGGVSSAVGDINNDWFFTNLTLADNSTFEWTFSSANTVDIGGPVAIEDSLSVFGAVEMEDGVTIQLVDGGAGSTTGLDVMLFWAINGATIDGVAPDVSGQWTPADLAKITVLPPPGHPDWTWDKDGFGNPILEYLFDEYVILKGLITGVALSHPGEATTWSSSTSSGA